MPRPIHFEFSADDPERAARFYEQTFGWKIQKAEMGGGPEYWLIYTGDGDAGINGGMARRGVGPETGTTNTIGVPDIDGAIEAVVKAGGRVTTDKMPIPGVGVLAYAADTEGNAFGMLQPEQQ